jgi:DNA (cytosine-5)-methyltransferase 1
MEVIDRSGARVFVMENVPQLLGSLEHSEILAWAKARGFKVWSDVLLAADYGVPQLRRRAIIVGSKDTDPGLYFPPVRTHYDPRKRPDQPTLYGGTYSSDAKPWRTVRDAVADLPAPSGTAIRDEKPPLDLHFGRNPTAKSVARYKAIPLEGMNRFDLQKNAPDLTPECWIRKKSGGTDLFGRLWWDRPAFTIRTEFFKPEKGRYLHPEQHRPITHREAARFQTFPDEFIFTGTKIQIAKQIGNAVPPVLGAAIARAVHDMWFSATSGRDGRLGATETLQDYVACSEHEYAAGSRKPAAS